MMNFQYIDGPHGVPIYFQRLNVRTVSLNWLVFVGSADDEAAGGHGVFHWFEHLPSRGTQSFPGGYLDTEARLVRHGGSADAETGCGHTAFSADVPKRVWTEALNILADMIGSPLLRDEDIVQERDVILQEIDEWHSAPYSHSLCELPGVLWPDHPNGHDQLGTRDSLLSMTPETLQQAHRDHYARNRIALVIAGNIEISELIDSVAAALERIPNRDVPDRRLPVQFGDVPEWSSKDVRFVSTDHDESVVYMLFPLPSWSAGIGKILQWDFIENVFDAGALGSPLNRLMREDLQLAYSPEFVSTTTPDGGYAGFVAQTTEDPQRVLEGFRRLIRSQEIRSQEWLDYVRDTIRGTIEMRDPDASDYVEEAASSLIHYGKCFTDESYTQTMLGYTNEQIQDMLDEVASITPMSIVFGK